MPERRETAEPSAGTGTNRSLND
ncbi:hypothetical protein F7O43_09505 [Neisseria meningitidis]|uniref:Uncharacterized protein n=1 Tax=Neisseria meningitidis serogroup B (strain ATCC BAA-335 / MC58) TaxID=122586 RepID=Q9JYP0_NEIMB|nr:hypothetical protein NMB1492 [Neisseria meningitidis MC58]AVI44372.1 hypothetical protein A6J53_15075 [Neisseria meningitidis]MBG8580812.1 hypothetical protein [Neisseria meningitidis]MBG8590013.1 hypothetical protein [Neisseria meningitidis]MBG8596376.1 hypothetical protein [Neisseria meningitidis]